MSRAHAVVDGCEGARFDPPGRGHAGEPPTGVGAPGVTAHTGSNGRVAGRYALDGYTIVWAHGEIDIATTPQLMQQLAAAVGAHRCRVIVELTYVTFMDSTGLNALVLARRRALAGSGELRLVGACGMVRKVLRMTGLEKVFPLHSTIEESIGQRARESVVGGLEQLDEIPSRVSEQDLASAGAGHDVADEGQSRRA